MPTRILDLPQCLAQIKASNYRKVVVSGPQRSGTHIGAKIIADMLKFRYIEEGDFKINSFPTFKRKYNKLLNIVVQAPGIAHKLHKLNPSWFIVFMYRSTPDIIASQKRINWRDEYIERNKYINEFNLSGGMLNEPICIIKYLCFTVYQLKFINTHAAKLSYESLSHHWLWVNTKDRPKKLYK